MALNAHELAVQAFFEACDPGERRRVEAKFVVVTHHAFETEHNWPPDALDALLTTPSYPHHAKFRYDRDTSELDRCQVCGSYDARCECCG